MVKVNIDLPNESLILIIN